MNTVDCVQVVTQITTTVTAVVMAYFAWKAYLKPLEQESEPENATEDNEEYEHLKEVVVFKTSKQETTLKLTAQGIECHLKDIREGRGGHKWTISNGEARQILEYGYYYVNPGYKAATGTFTLGKRKNWLYSKKLFPEPEYLHGVLKQLLESTASN